MPDSEKTAMFNDIVSYIVRRAVCGLTPKNYNNWFMSVLRQWIKGEPTREALKDLLASSPNSPAARWPEDDEFVHAFQTAPTYYGNLDAGRCRMLLTELEGWLRLTKRTEEPSIPDLSNLDIDHILPRSWYEHWTLPGGSKATFAESQAAEQQELVGSVLSDHYQAIRRRAKAIRIPQLACPPTCRRLDGA
ncbi:HNH endonuclease family protein [Stenotrophomonas maltophilia]|uniref:HNH endonuclease family protein n=1 Tax=Stenotrophomonas maltophilia TaxID=40324 RepID=UPI002E7959A1|nr:HNH endonuclease family protein [Stenotrophomonas maltophilia]